MLYSSTSLISAMSTPKTIDPEAILKQLTTEERVALLSGDDGWHTVAIPRLGIPRVRVRGLSSFHICR